MPHADAFDVMVELSQAIPTSMKHDVDELDVQKAHVTVRGIVGTVSDAQTIASTLAEDKCLADVKIKSATQVVGSDRQKYVMEMELRVSRTSRRRRRRRVTPRLGPARLPARGQMAGPPSCR